MENKRIQVKVRVIKIFASKEDGWCSFRAEDDNGKQYRFAGTVGTAPEVNALYEIEAEEQKSKFGIQYKIIRAELGLPETIAGIFEYLASGHIKGIGKVTAKKLVDRFGNETLNIIHNSPDKLLEIRGISQKKLDQIIISSEENRSIEDIYRITYGAVTKLQAKKLYDTYGKDTVKKLREDPYKTLCQLDGIGFLKADKVALGCGVGLYSEIRAANAVLYVLNDVITASGDSYVPISQMEQETTLLLAKLPAYLEKIRGAKNKVLNAADNYDSERKHLIQELRLEESQVTELDQWIEDRKNSITAIANAIETLIASEDVVYDPDREIIASKKIYDTEVSISRMVNGLLRAETMDTYDPEHANDYINTMLEAGNVYNEEQKAAFMRALMYRISIVTGGPGCGKTTAIALIAGYWDSLGKEVYLMAPTGRAAQRIKESIQQQLPGNRFNISTIDYLLANSEAKSNLEEMDSEDVLVICDESSMIDIRLAYKFLSLAKDYRVVLVGDADQLPPVGAGNFFRDLIGTRYIPTTWLTKNYRSTGLIIDNARKINHGDSKLKTGKDFSMIGLDREEIPARIVTEYMETLKREQVSIRDLCVLTLQRKRGVACLSTLNRMIQEAYNPAREGVPEYKMQDYIFRVGDRVIHLKNNYSMVRTQRDGTAIFGVFNGDLGIIEKFNPEYLTDQDGENANESDDEPWVLMVRFDDGSSAVYKETDLLQLELAYAMTTHKAQGSEFKYVIGTFAMDQYTMLSRAIVYTSVTRAKLKYTAVCEKKAFAMAIRNVGSSKRNTFLPELMTENHISA